MKLKVGTREKFSCRRSGQSRLLLIAVLLAAAALIVAWWFRHDRPSGTDPGTSASGVSSAESETVELDQAKQKSIWDAEHATFEIEARLGKRFLAAWTERDGERLAEILQPDFTAVTGESASSSVSHGDVSQSSLVFDSSVSSSADQQTFLTTITEPLAEYEHMTRRLFKVLRIDRQNDDRWGFRLLLSADGEDANGELLSLVSEHDVVCHFTDRAQLDSAPVIESWNVVSLRMLRSKGALFREVTEDVGLNALALPDNWEISTGQIRQYQFQMAVDDYDHDGYPDIAVMTEDGDPYLLHSEQGKRFTVQTSRLETVFGGSGPSSVVCWIDYDNDDYPDLLIGNRLLHNEQGERFVDVTYQSGLSLEMRPQGCSAVDYDCDGLLDLYVLYQHPYGEALRLHQVPRKVGWIGDHSSGGSNQLWRNLGNGKFVDVTRKSGAGGGYRHTFAASWFFADDDHYPDLYIANDLGRNTLLYNLTDGKFKDMTDETETGDYATSMGVATGDMDNDGGADIYVANMYSKMGRRIIQQVNDADYPAGIYDQIKGSCAGNRLYRRQPGSVNFSDTGEQQGVHGVGWAYAPALADFDNDGWLDIYATAGFLSFDRTKPDG